MHAGSHVKGKRAKLGSREDYSLGVSSYLIRVLWLQQEGFRASQRIIQIHLSSFTCPQRQVCVSPPGTKAGVGAGDAGCEEDKLRAPLPAACVQPGGEGDWLPAETPLKDSVRGYSFPLTHHEKQKYCNADRGTKGSAVINEHGGGSLLVEESKALLTIFPWHWDHCSAGQQQTGCSPAHLRCWQRHCSLCQA